MSVFTEFAGIFPDGADWAVSSPVDNLMPWRVVILSADRKREGIGTSKQSLEDAVRFALANWQASA